MGCWLEGGDAFGDLMRLSLIHILLGDMEGFEVIKKLRGQGISTPVIIISGRDEDYDTLYGLSLGADDYITKPFRPVIIGAKVKALIRRDKTHMMGVCLLYTSNLLTLWILSGEVRFPR